MICSARPSGGLADRISERFEARLGRRPGSAARGHRRRSPTSCCTTSSDPRDLALSYELYAYAIRRPEIADLVEAWFARSQQRAAAVLRPGDRAPGGHIHRGTVRLSRAWPASSATRRSGVLSTSCLPRRSSVGVGCSRCPGSAHEPVDARARSQSQNVAAVVHQSYTQICTIVQVVSDDSPHPLSSRGCSSCPRCAPSASTHTPDATPDWLGSATSAAGGTPCSSIFAACGFALAAWVSRTPAVRDSLGASTSHMGWLIFAIAGGAIFGLVSAACADRPIRGSAGDPCCAPHRCRGSRSWSLLARRSPPPPVVVHRPARCSDSASAPPTYR